jgi:tRNA(Ile)-lysidine synthase
MNVSERSTVSGERCYASAFGFSPFFTGSNGFTVHCSLFTVHCSPFTVHCSDPGTPRPARTLREGMIIGTLRSFVEEHLGGSRRIVVAASGGADSTALLLALSELKGPELVCAHIDHQLRGEESAGDAAFVQRLAADLGVPCSIVAAAPDEGAIRERGVEAAARSVRYRALESIRRQYQADWIVTGHTLDDQAETVLMRLLQRAGPETLQGILPLTAERVARPFLAIRRADLHQWLRARGAEPRHDSTNDELRFLRNTIRHRLLPLLAADDRTIIERLGRIAAMIRQHNEALEPYLASLDDRWTRTGDGSAIELAQLPPDEEHRRLMLLREIQRLRPGGRRVRSSRLPHLADELSSRAVLSLGNGLEATREAGLLVLRSAQPPEERIPFERTFTCGEAVRIPRAGATIRIRRMDSCDGFTNEDRTRQVFALAESAADPIFTVRSRRAGDRFQPLGFPSEKKLKSFLIDRKVPKEHREKLPLLLYGDTIVWVPGVEVSERFRVLPGRHLFEVSIDYDPGGGAARQTDGKDHQFGRHLGADAGTGTADPSRCGR